MKEFKDKVTVITGAASGIGHAIAQRCVQEGMKVVLADINEKALIETEKEMKAQGATVLSVLTDTSEASDVEALAQKTLDNFGAVHLLFNNAGVGIFSSFMWENSLADWNWMIGVNLWGVIHGIRFFLPLMLEQDTECHIVNTGSLGGLISRPGLGIYQVTKHGVVSLSETLYYELAEKQAKIKVSVLCPAHVNTQIINSEQNRPAKLQNVSTEVKDLPASALFRQAVQAGMSPNEVADHVFQAIKDEKFYILTHPEGKYLIQLRLEDILQERNPTNPANI